MDSIRDLKSMAAQSFPGKPKYTEKDVPDLKGKVCIVTGSNTGIGKEVAQILYAKNASVYVAARSEDKSRAAIKSIQDSHPESSGKLDFLRLDLADLPSIRGSANEFLSKEKRLDVLFNNAGVAWPEKGSTTKQGFELQLGVNCLGTFSFTKFLTPILAETAKTAPKDSVRVVWVSSSAAEGANAKTFLSDVKDATNKSGSTQYFASKLGNFYHNTQYAERHRSDGIASVSLNPGNLDSDLWRTQGTIATFVLKRFVLHPVINGAYTELFAGFSKEITAQKSGSHIAPWGKLWTVPRAMQQGAKSKADGGNGDAQEFWDWTEAQIKPYL